MLIFKRTTPHGALDGHTFRELSEEELAEILKGAPHRVVYVAYAKAAIVHRLASANVSQAQTYGSNSQAKHPIYINKEGLVSFGGDMAHQRSHCETDEMMKAHNDDVQQGLTPLRLPILEQFRRAVVFDNEENIVPLRAHILDPYDFPDLITRTMYNNYRRRNVKHFDFKWSRIQLKEERRIGKALPEPAAGPMTVIPATYNSIRTQSTAMPAVASATTSTPLQPPSPSATPTPTPPPSGLPITSQLLHSTPIPSGSSLSSTSDVPSSKRQHEPEDSGSIRKKQRTEQSEMSDVQSTKASSKASKRKGGRKGAKPSTAATRTSKRKSGAVNAKVG